MTDAVWHFVVEHGLRSCRGRRNDDGQMGRGRLGRACVHCRVGIARMARQHGHHSLTLLPHAGFHVLPLFGRAGIYPSVRQGFYD